MEKKGPMNYIKKKIGSVIIAEGQTTTKTYECAAWYKNLALTPGTYDVFGLFEKYGPYSGVKPEFVGKEEMKWVTYTVPGVVTGDCFDSLFCGNLIAPHRNEHVGEPETHYVQMYPYALAQALSEGLPTSITLDPGYRAQPHNFEYQEKQLRTWEIVAVEPAESVSVDTVSS